MISSLGIKNFKCFKDESFRLAPFTLLSGVNGMGKSSVVQALNLLRQSTQLDHRGLLLNGYYVELGTATDALYEGGSDFIEFSLESDAGIEAKWRYLYEKGLHILPFDEEFSDVPEDIYLRESLFGDKYHYLQAERVGPRTSFKMSDNEVLQHSHIGKTGEYCAHLIAKKERSLIPIAGLAHPGAETLEVRDQLEAWISEINSGTRVHVTEYPKMDIVNLEFSFIRNGLPTQSFRATNVGFGLTYSLPIFVAVLLAEPGSMIVVENPEAHLHPKGQACMGRFLALAANHGVQVIVETHSDHVLNGLRIAVKDGDIDFEKVAIHFFSKSDENSGSKVISPKINANGRLDKWPEDFFDEWEKGLAQLF